MVDAVKSILKIKDYISQDIYLVKKIIAYYEKG